MKSKLALLLLAGFMTAATQLIAKDTLIPIGFEVDPGPPSDMQYAFTGARWMAASKIQKDFGQHPGFQKVAPMGPGGIRVVTRSQEASNQIWWAMLRSGDAQLPNWFVIKAHITPAPQP